MTNITNHAWVGARAGAVSEASEGRGGLLEEGVEVAGQPARPPLHHRPHLPLPLLQPPDLPIPTLPHVAHPQQPPVPGLGPWSRFPGDGSRRGGLG